LYAVQYGSMAPLVHVVFIGVLGRQHQAVEHQLQPSLKKLGITERAVPESELVAILKETPTSTKLVKKLHVGGVVAGQLEGSGKSLAFRIVVYDGDGNLVSDLESPMSGRALAKGDIAMFESNLGDIAGAPKPASSSVAAGSSLPSSGGDDDAPPGLGDSAKPTTTATASSPDDAPAAAPEAVQTTAAAHTDRAIHVQAALVLGIVGRNMATVANTVEGDSSSPVATGGVEGAITIGAHARVTALFEHTLVMHTEVAADNASTDIGHGELVASYDLLDGNVKLGPALGIGETYFEIDSMSTARPPDVNYIYVLLGGAVTMDLAPRWTLRGLAAFEPVVGGLPPGMAPYPSRWGFGVGAALEYQATPHVFARAALDYQAFSSSWTMGSTMDGYPTGTAAVGAAF